MALSALGVFVVDVVICATESVSAVAVRVGGGAAVARLSVGSSRSVSTLGDLVDLRADTTPYRNALQATHQRVRFDYNDVKTYVDAYAAGLHEAGYSGSKLAVWLGNDSENVRVGRCVWLDPTLAGDVDC